MRILLLSTLLLLMVGCASTKKDQQTNLFPEYSFQELERMANEAKARADKSSSELVDINSAIMENKKEITHIATVVDELSPNRIEELEVHLALLTEAYKDLYEQLAAIKVLPQVRYVKPTPKKPTSFSVSKATVDLLGGDEYSLYSQAQEQYRGGFYEKSIQTWKHLLQSHPNTRYSSNAHYWIGSALMALSRFDEALLSFHSAETAPESRHRSRSLLMSAKCYLKLHENDKAVEKLKFLISRYPQSTAITEARSLLNKISPSAQ